MIMKYYFLAGIFPDSLYSEIIANSKGSIHFAADALQKSFIEGLSELYENFEIVNFPFIHPYPQRYRRLFISESETIYRTYKGKDVICYNLGFCNLFEYKKKSIERSAYSFFDRELSSNVESICIIIYAITTSTLNACSRLKAKYGNRVKTVLIVPDLPQHTYDASSYIHRFYYEYQSRIFKKGYLVVDAFVLLSKYMADSLPVEGKPWTVVEGIYNLKDDINQPPNESKKEKVVFYAGSLSMRYGIKNLVDAFVMTKNDNYRLQICGNGDAVGYIKECCKKDRRIDYLGQLPRSQAVELQRGATLLVNPRTSEGEYTKYSFPSKTMEYLASGVPTLLYKLPGIPEDYFNYCFYLSDESVKVLSKKLEEILSMDIENLSKIGNEARKFILQHKNPYAQCKKVKALTDIIIKR